ncbi:MAG: cytochrome c3 family protein [Planctomycetota bacterium]
MRKGQILTSYLLLLMWCIAAGAGDGDQKLLGDESDGGRAHPIHRLELLASPGAEGEEALTVDPNVNTAEEVLLPFSTRLTCGKCHSYGIIKQGWHFNAADPNVADHGRPGQPWIYVDARIATQIPLSYRSWPGTFKPGQFGLTERGFTKIFGRQTPGGGPGERVTEDPDEIMRQYISGRLEINCLSCHNGDPRQDQGGPAGYAVQISRGNFRWAAAASSGLAAVKGSADDMDEAYDPFDPFAAEMVRGSKTPPSIAYHENVFDIENKVFFDIRREVPSYRCYFCHSNLYMGGGETEKWSSDEDIHLKAGLTCVDCHRNGIDHNIVRGYAGEEDASDNELAAASSCEGCHLGEDSSVSPAAGRLGAPVPKHPGIPPVHFEKLTCTACHAGPWPAAKPYVTKTSMAHRLGTPNVNKAREMLPHISSPVFAEQEDGKIAPHKLVWPSFWAVLKDDKAEPIVLDTVTKIIGEVLSREEFPSSGDWPALTADHIVNGLSSLASGGSLEGRPVYVSGGKLYSLDESGQLKEQQDHPAAKPYLWPIGHDVRPAAQSLGIRYCTDCHATNAPFFFGDVTIDTPVAAARKAKKMVEFQDIDPFYARAFAFSFVFRPMMKIIALCCCAVLAVVLLLYALKALACVVSVLAGEN